MKYYLGVDGGGTKTRVAILNEQDRIVCEGQSGPSSIDTVSWAQTEHAIIDAVGDFFDRHPDGVVDSIFAGLGGIVTEQDCIRVETALRSLPFLNANTNVRARNDMENALYSGGLFEEGMTLICGTGMVAYGIDRYGTHHKSGGWGYKEGDLGSAYDLGVQSLRHVVQAFDGRAIKDDFSIEIANSVGLREASDIIGVIDQWVGNRTKIATLAPLVTSYANRGNKTALAIVYKATNDLALAVHAVHERLVLERSRLVIVGSLGNAPGIFRDSLLRQIHSLDPNIEIVPSIHDPAVAAAMMAKMTSHQT